jgi:hypothetical protein
MSRELIDGIKAELAAHGLTCRVERGGKHDKVYVGNTLATLLSRGTKMSPRTYQNTIAQVRRTIRQVQTT